MVNIIVVIIIAVIIITAVCYIVKEKKRGVKCIGCPYATQCAARGKCSGPGNADRKESADGSGADKN